VFPAHRRGCDTQPEQALRRMAQKGADPIIAVGFGHAPALEMLQDKRLQGRREVLGRLVLVELGGSVDR